MHAYDKTYLELAMDGMGAMMDFAVGALKLDPLHFYERFLSSGIDEEIEKGNPRYLAGLSGRELAERVIEKTGGTTKIDRPYRTQYGPAYWTGWILCLLQWNLGCRFAYIHENGLDTEAVLSLYPTLHEADPNKFLEIARIRMEASRKTKPTRLKSLRKATGLTQAQLAKQSGISLRAIQSYEQRYLDISRAEAGSLRNLATVFGCPIEELLEQ